ncbi:hypothetical protein G4B88_030665 [Cannabis sativa]|uniref:RNase H type-1 domain-containing protein n=1 Tax=Cannabis sativa TaxID=3483 RepID=A0A7J6H6T0_CANSA|nr:hypothetical protein G4B88_030665 [Cannabis sativa]
MDDSIGDFSSNPKSSIGPHSNSLSIFPADCSLASMDLHEVPIIYENNVIPGEGKNKRRKSNSTCLNNIGSAISGLVFANDGSVFKAQVSNVGRKENMPWGSRFHFEKAWADNDECMEIIKEVWSNKYSRQPMCDELTGWFHHEDIPWVLGINPNREREDIIGWSFTPNGQYTVASGYKLRFSHLQLQTDSTPPLPSMKKSPVSWSPPPSGTFMINTDASLVVGQPGCGLGMVIRDHLGAVVVAETIFIPGCLSVNMAESLAIRSGLKLADCWSLSNICISSDCQSVSHALNGDNHSITDWGLMVKDCIKAKENFNLCNKVANCLASWARLFKTSEVWTSSMPLCAAAVLEADLPCCVCL